MSTEQTTNRIALWRSQILDPDRDPLTPLEQLLDAFEADVRAAEQAEAWQEGFVAAAEWIAACGRPSNIGPPDPPLNPYEEESQS